MRWLRSLFACEQHADPDPLPKWKIVSYSTRPGDMPGWYTTGSGEGYRTYKQAESMRRQMDLQSVGRHWRHEIKPFDFPEWKRS